MIKYLGSKRRWVPALAAMAAAVDTRTAVDLFTGTTRVAQAWKRAGVEVTAVDSASYSKVLADCYVATNASALDGGELTAALGWLAQLPPARGYVTEVFCERARFFQPHNGMRIDAIRDGIESYSGSPLYPLLLASLLLAADRVDSTTGLQMAYLKSWAPRSFRELTLAAPDLIPGPGAAVQGDAREAAHTLPEVDFAYLDPPYNQHRYDSNYHVWETLVRWDEPEHYGTACKRVDLRDPATRSPFNSRRTLATALADVIAAVRARVVVVSYNDESWVAAGSICEWLQEAGHESVAVLAFDANRYVGARIGIHDPRGRRVGTVGRTRNVEWMFVAGPHDDVRRAVAAGIAHGARRADRDVTASLR